MQTGATMTDANVPLQFKWMGRVVCMLVCLVSVVGVILAEVGYWGWDSVPRTVLALAMGLVGGAVTAWMWLRIVQWLLTVQYRSAVRGGWPVIVFAAAVALGAAFGAGLAWCGHTVFYKPGEMSPFVFEFGVGIGAVSGAVVGLIGWVTALVGDGFGKKAVVPARGAVSSAACGCNDD